MPSTLDIVILMTFLLLNLGVGLWYARSVKTLRGYAVGNKNFATWMITLIISVTWIYSNTVQAAQSKPMLKASTYRQLTSKQYSLSRPGAIKPLLAQLNPYNPTSPPQGRAYSIYNQAGFSPLARLPYPFTYLCTNFVPKRGKTTFQKIPFNAKNPRGHYTIIGIAITIGIAGVVAATWTQQEVPALDLGYGDGYYSIYTFEDTIDAFEKIQNKRVIHEEQAEVFYDHITKLLFEVQEKIIQCKALSRTTGFPLYHSDWQRYKKVRDRAESLMKHVCDLHTELTPIEDMQALEDAFFKPARSGDNPVGAFLEGMGNGVIDTPKNILKNTFKEVKSIVWDIPYWLAKETADKVLDPLFDHQLFIRRINRFHYDIDTFETKYKKNELPGKDLVATASQIIIEAHDIEFDIDVFKSGCHNYRDRIQKKRHTLLDEFCLQRERDDIFQRYGKALSRMSPAQKAEAIGYMLSSIVVEALLIGDIGRLGDLDQIDQNSVLGRWINKTKGGRSAFKKIQKAHQRISGLQANKLDKGQVTVRKVRQVVCMEEIRNTQRASRKFKKLKAAFKKGNKGGEGME